MTKDTYTRSKNYLSQLADSIQKTETEPNNVIDTPLRLADNSCVGGSCQGSTVEENGYQQDLSSYVKGILVQTGVDSGATMVNVVNDPVVLGEVQNNYLTTDINNDAADDVLMRDSNSVYTKYAHQDSEHYATNTNHIGSKTRKFYAYEGKFGKRWIDSIQELIDRSNDGYVDIQDISLKLRDTTSEVKNFETIGQTFDSIQFSRANNASRGEAVSGYVIKYSHDIHTFREKIQTFSFFGRNTTDIKYILVLPNETSYTTGLLSVGDISKKPITKLLTGTVLAVKYYDPSQDIISISVQELPRQRQYAQIATLINNPDGLSSSQKDNFSLYIPASPRSNQIVAGNQLLGDIEPPQGTFTLERILTNEIISTGNEHE